MFYLLPVLKRIFFGSIVLSIFLLVVVGYLSANADALAVSWYNSEWTSRQPIVVTNPSGSAMTDHQVNITLTSSNFSFSNTQSDGSDIRITDSDGTTLIPYWIEEYNQSSRQANIWVKVPSISASSSTTIYIYYGNSSPDTFELPPVGPYQKLPNCTSGDQTDCNPLFRRGRVTSITVTNGGSGYTSAPTVSFSGGSGTGAAATAILTDGVVTSVTLTDSGSGVGGYGYISVPTVSFSGGGGTGAAATAIVDQNADYGKVTSVTVTNAGGSGYTSAPTVSFSGGVGSGAAATATVSGGAVTAVTVTNQGSGYTSAPTVSFSGGGGTGATATAGIGINTIGSGVLPENIVYDDDTEKYWMAFTDRRSTGSFSLAYSTDLINWTEYSANPVVALGAAVADSPHLLKHEGRWYAFYASTGVNVAVADSITGPYQVLNNGSTILNPVADTWENQRVLEPYVFQKADGDWVMMYMADIGESNHSCGGTTGNNQEQIGFATTSSDNFPLGSDDSGSNVNNWTKSDLNPVIAFGDDWSYDDCTIADPFVYLHGDTYYIFYAASHTEAFPWVQAYVTTKDFVTFTKHNLVVAQGSQRISIPDTFDSNNAHRGALSKFGDYYYMTYDGLALRSGGIYRPGIAKMYAKSTAQGYPPEQVFDLYEDFAGSISNTPDTTANTVLNSQMRAANFFGTYTANPCPNGDITSCISSGVISLSSGRATLNVRPYVKLLSIQEFGPGFLLEASVKHPNADGTGVYSSGIGFGNDSFNTFNANFWESGQTGFGNAGSFVDNRNSVSFGDPAAIEVTGNTSTSSPITVEAWVKLNSNTQAASYILSKASSWGFYVSGSSTHTGKINVIYNGASIVTTTTNVISSSDLDSWMHLAFTYSTDGSTGTTQLFKNGVELATSGTFNSNIATTASNLYAGIRDNTFINYLDGVVDEVRISNSVRYSTDFTVPSAPFSSDANTLALWHFNETSGTSVADSSSSGITGTLQGGKGINIHAHSSNNWIKSTSSTVGGQSDMGQEIDSSDYHTQRIWWKSSSEAQFQYDNNDWESITTNIPSATLPVWAQVDVKNDNTVAGTLNIDYLQVRKYNGTEPTLSVGSAESIDGVLSSTNTQAGPQPCTSTAPKSAPILYGASVTSSKSVNIEFTKASSDVTGYVVEYGTDPNDLAHAATINSSSVSSYEIGSLSSNTKYYFRVRASNQCATGPWSNILSATTSSLFKIDDLVTEITDYTTRKNDDECEIHSVDPGDTLTSIAAQYFGDTTKYTLLVDNNKSQYPSLVESPGLLQVGWQLSLCEPKSEENRSTLEKLTIKVVDSENNPIGGASVTLHSTPRYATTDEEGNATFQDVEYGEHKVVIEHQGNKGEQSIFVSDENVESVSIEIKIYPVSPFRDRNVVVVIIFLLIGLSLALVKIILMNRSKGSSSLKK